MSNILCVHEQMNLPIHWNTELGGHNVVLGVGIVVRIKTKYILGRLTNLLRMKRTELSIRTGIAEIESKLSGLNLNGHSGTFEAHYTYSPQLFFIAFEGLPDQEQIRDRH